MRKGIILIILSLVFTIAPTQKSHAIYWVVVKAALKKVIKAMDLQVQRLQNKTIWLQNAQKTLENTLSKVQLDEISDWVGKNKQQYENYYQELKTVKDAISDFKRVKEIIGDQLRIVEEYKRAFGMFSKDGHFTVSDLNYMRQVYNGIIEESLKDLDQLYLVVKPAKTEMSDGQRINIVAAVAARMSDKLNDLRSFNRQAIQMSLLRSRDAHEVEIITSLYGIK